MSTLSATAIPLSGLPVWLSAIAGSRQARDRSEAGQTKPRVLVIDDEDTICELLSLYLADKGLEVATVRSAAEARALAGRGQFDLVILDWRLEGTEGLDLLHLWKAQHPDIPVIIYTGAHLEEPRIEGSLACEADAVVRKGKPFDELFTAIFQSLGRRQVETRSAVSTLCTAC
jgi:two-component system, OmpR family, response regulator